MDNPSQQPAKTPPVTDRETLSADEASSGFAKPVVAYTANGNLEAHSVVTWLGSNGVRACVVEDNSGASLFAFGTISQFHKPQVFVDQSDLESARSLVQQFEQQRDRRRSELDAAPAIESECEECGVSSEFPAAQDGTTQNCPKCHSFMDVGTFDWPEDFDFSATESDVQPVDDPEDLLAEASQLDKLGQWDAAITAFRDVANRWPEHAIYAENCIAETQRKIDTAAK